MNIVMPTNVYVLVNRKSGIILTSNGFYSSKRSAKLGARNNKPWGMPIENIAVVELKAFQSNPIIEVVDENNKWVEVEV